jgi:hypothetical protein
MLSTPCAFGGWDSSEVWKGILKLKRWLGALVRASHFGRKCSIQRVVAGSMWRSGVTRFCHTFTLPRLRSRSRCRPHRSALEAHPSRSDQADGARLHHHRLFPRLHRCLVPGHHPPPNSRLGCRPRPDWRKRSHHLRHLARFRHPHRELEDVVHSLDLLRS